MITSEPALAAMPAIPPPPSKDNLSIRELVETAARYGTLYSSLPISPSSTPLEEEMCWGIEHEFIRAALERAPVTVEDHRAQLCVLAQQIEFDGCSGDPGTLAIIERFSPGENWSRLPEVLPYPPEAL